MRPPSPIPKGWKPLPAPELKPEEIEAIRLFEQAVAQQPGEREPNELFARHLEPYAVRQYQRVVEARGKTSPPPAPPTSPTAATSCWSIRGPTSAATTTLTTGRASRGS